MVASSPPPKHTAEASPRQALATALAPVVLAPAIVVLILVAFAWPAARLAPRDLPIGVAGPAADAVAAHLHTGLAGSTRAVDTHRYPDEAAARTAIEEREVYGAVITGPGGITVLTASAASPAVAQLLPQVTASAMAATAGKAAMAGEAGTAAMSRAGDGTPAVVPTTAPAADAAPAATALGAAAAPGPAAAGLGANVSRVVDVVPAPAGDPRGVALAASIFPLVLAGMIVGGMVTSTTRPGLGQIGILVTASAAVGLAATGIAQGRLGILGGSWWAVAGALAFLVLAVAASVAGLRALFGIGGFVSGAALFVLVGNPWSGFTSAPELLPQAVGTIGELLPPGAGGSLLRTVAFFEGNGAGGYVLVLMVWFVVGVAGVCAGTLRSARRSSVAEDTSGGRQAPVIGTELIASAEPAASACGAGV